MTAIATRARALHRVLPSEDDPFAEHEGDEHLALTRSKRTASSGSGGEWFVTRKKEFFFGKSYDGNEEQVLVEGLANALYALFRVPVPDSFLRRIKGVPHLLSREVKGGTVGPEHLGSTNVRRHFVVDAWLAAWDVVGDDFDNVVVTNGKSRLLGLPMPAGTGVRVDNGCALHLDSRGHPKRFGEQVLEIFSMRDPQYPSGQVFAQLTDAEVAGQIRRFLADYARNRDSVVSRVEQSGLPRARRTKILAALEARVAWLATVALPKLHQAAVKASGGDTRRAMEAQLKVAEADTWDSEVNRSRQHWPRSPLSDGEIMALCCYTQGDFMEIGQALRGNGLSAQNRRMQLEAYRAHIELLTSGLRKMPDFRGQVTRIVELGAREKARYVKGRVITEPAPTSASDGGDCPYPGNVVFDITSKHGKRLKRIGSKHEREVLFAPKAHFKVMGQKLDRDEEQLHIKVVEVDA